MTTLLETAAHLGSIGVGVVAAVLLTVAVLIGTAVWSRKKRRRKAALVILRILFRR